MRFVKCLALSAVVFGILSVHVQAAVPVASGSQRAMMVRDQPAVAPDPAAMSDSCTGLTDLGILPAAGGTWLGDTTGLANDFEDDYPATCSYGAGSGSGADEIFHFQVDSTGVWDFNTCDTAGFDTSLGIRVDSGGGCPGDAMVCDGDACGNAFYESDLSAFLVAGTDYFMVVDGWVQGTEGPFTVTYVQTLAACTDDASCADGDPCNGDEVCNLGNGQCEPGTSPCDRSQSCADDGSGNAVCTDPDGCLIYENFSLAGWTSLGGGTEGTLIGDDWGFEVGNLGRELDHYSTTAVGVAGPFIVATTIWPHGKNCVGGSDVPACGSQGGQCDTDADCTGGLCVGGALGCDFNGGNGAACTTDADCPGNCDTTTSTLCVFDSDCPLGETCIDQGTCPTDGTCQDLGFFAPNQRPARAEIPGTLCVFLDIPSGYYTTLTCTPGTGAVMPADGAHVVMGFVQTGGAAGPGLTGNLSEIGSSGPRFSWDQGTNAADWTRFYFPSLPNGGGWVGDLCTVPLGACCDPGLGGTCSIVTEANCAGMFIGENNATTEFDCGADADVDGVTDPCDACPNNADFAADTGPCNCDSTDSDGDGTLDCVDACPNNADFAADTGDCNCSSSDLDGDGVLDCVDACPTNADFAADQGPCQCSSADADGDGTLDCIDGCVDDPNKIEPGICGCGVDDNADSDGDGVPDCIDQCNGVDDAVFAPECVGAIPTVSEWGLVILALLLLAAGKVYFGRKSATA